MKEEIKKEEVDIETFKKWMSGYENGQDCSMTKKPYKSKDLIGIKVESKINKKKLLNKISFDYDLSEDKMEEIAEVFVDEGGTVIENLDKHFIIETESGTFTIHHCYVKRA